MTKIKKKKIETEFKSIEVTYVCDGKPISVIVDVEDFSSSEHECELCGSHGEVSVCTPKCPVCGISHSFELKSW